MIDSFDIIDDSNKIKWIDSHCHPQYEPLNKESIKEALNNNIHKICCIGTKLDDIDFLLECKKEFNINISLGEHPLNDITNLDWSILEKNIDCLSAIGEMGFDFQSNLVDQEKIFDIQANLALQYNLPVILHIRDSGNGEVEDLIIRKLKQFNELKGVFHCFVGSKTLLNFAIDRSFFISFSGIITFKNADNLRKLIPFVPKDLILIETDAPYLAPIPKRGKKNHPIFVKYIGEFIADYLNMDHETFSDIVSKNFDTLYNNK